VSLNCDAYGDELRFEPGHDSLRERSLQSERPSENPLPDLGAAASSRVGAVSALRMMAACAAALVLPGLGHMVLGRWARAAVIGLGIAAMFGLGLWMQGHLFKPEPGEWLTWLFTFFDLGIGLPYFACLAADVGFKLYPAAPTYEYGNTFLAVAGLLNMLAVMDAYDIAVGRKA
jgi:hypothetical protein